MMNLKSLVFRRGTDYYTCWMLDGHILLNDLLEFYEVCPPAEVERHLIQLACDKPKKLIRYKLGLRFDLMNIIHGEYFCAPRDVRYILAELVKLAGTKPRTGPLSPADEFMLEQLIEQCDADDVARTADAVYKLAETVHKDEHLHKRLKRQRPDIAAALELVAVDDEAVPAQNSTKKARPYDLKKRPTVHFPPPRAEEEEVVVEECEECADEC